MSPLPRLISDDRCVSCGERSMGLDECDSCGAKVCADCESCYDTDETGFDRKVRFCSSQCAREAARG